MYRLSQPYSKVPQSANSRRANSWKMRQRCHSLTRLVCLGSFNNIVSSYGRRDNWVLYGLFSITYIFVISFVLISGTEKYFAMNINSYQWPQRHLVGLWMKLIQPVARRMRVSVFPTMDGEKSLYFRACVCFQTPGRWTRGIFFLVVLF